MDEQNKQNVEFLKVFESNLKSLHDKEFSLEKDKIVRLIVLFRINCFNKKKLFYWIKLKIEAERQRANEELKKELARQASAHNNHLAQMLRIQQDELQSLYDK